MTAPGLVSVVVPAWQEATHVRPLLGRILRAMDVASIACEVVLVDDGSTDGTSEAALEVAAADPRVRVERHASNLGKGAALATGVSAARGDPIVFLDADLELAPEALPGVLEHFRREGADVLVGSKYAPGASERRPFHRVLLSRLYWVVTSLLFRLPIRDTQTGLKILRRDLAAAVVPRTRIRRWAWDIEVLVLAHRAGARIVAAPVAVDFVGGGARFGLAGLLASARDTAAVFLRARCLGGCGPRSSRRTGAPPRVRPRTTFLVAADDAGLSRSVDAGIAAAAAASRLRSASLLAEGATAASAATTLAGVPVPGLHLALGGRRPATFVLRELFGLGAPVAVRGEVRRQVEAARRVGIVPMRLDTHRHLGFPAPAFRALCAEAAALGLREVRRPVPIGTIRAGTGFASPLRGLVLHLAGLATRGVPRAFGLASPDGFVDLAIADGWLRRGRLPVGVRGRTVEVLAHPAAGTGDVPEADRGPDRLGDGRRLEGFRERAERLAVCVRDGTGVRPGGAPG